MSHIDQVRDGEVPAALAATYVEIRRSFAADEVPLVLRALAPISGALARTWRALGPNVRTLAFDHEARNLHAAGVRRAVDLGTPLLEPVLRAAGLDVDALDVLREEVRRFEAVETRAWLFAAGLARWLDGERLAGRRPAAPSVRGELPAGPRPLRPPGGVARELMQSLVAGLHLPEATPVLRLLSESERVLSALTDGLDPVLRHPAFGRSVTELEREARLAWDRLSLVVSPMEGDVDPADRMRWRHVARSFEEAGARHGLFAAAVRVAFDGAQDALETPGDDEPGHRSTH